MKLKNIISAVLMAVVILTASSCEDMFKVDSKVVLYDDENTLDQATDTVYSDYRTNGIPNFLHKKVC